MNITELRESLEQAARQLESSKTLDLSHNDLSSSSCIQETLMWLTTNKPSIVLLNDCNFNDNAVIALAKFFRDATYLHRISFRDNYIRAAGAREWLETLKNNSHITSIDFLGNDVGDAAKDLIEWYLASSTCRSLCGLAHHIQGFSIEDVTKSDALLIAANLEKNTDLRSIEIFGNEPLIALEVIFNALAANRTLARLKITKFPVSIMALNALSRGLSKNLSLKTLELALDGDMPEIREGKSITALFDAVECGRSLTAIRFENLPSGPVVDNLCARLIQNHRSLMHFSIFQYKPNQSAVDLLCRGISQNSNLRLLRLVGELAGKLNNDSYREIGDAAMSRTSGLPLVVRIEGEEDRYFASPDLPADSINSRLPEWEIDDFVELKILRNTWVSAQIIALLSDGEYCLIRANGEVHSNVSVDDIRKGSQFKHAQESTQTIVTPGGRDRHAARATSAGADTHRRNGITATTGPRQGKSNDSAFIEGELVEVRFYGDSNWYAARVQSAVNGMVDVVMTDDGTTELQVESHMIRRPSPSASSVATTYDPGMYIRGDYVFARVQKNSGSWVRARVVSDKKNGTYDVRLEDQSDEKGLRGRHLKHYFKLNDEVDARRNKSFLWERAVVSKTDREGKYLLTFQTDDETEADVPGRRIMIKGRDEIRTQAVLNFNREKYCAAEAVPSTTVSNRQSRKSSSRFTLNENVEIQVSSKWVEGRVVGLNPDNTYSIRLLDGSTLENVGESLLRKTRKAESSSNSTVQGSIDGPVPTRPSGPAPSNSFKEKSRRVRTDSADSGGEDKDKDRKERRERRRKSSADTDIVKKKSSRPQMLDASPDNANAFVESDRGERQRRDRAESTDSQVATENASIAQQQQRLHEPARFSNTDEKEPPAVKYESLFHIGDRVSAFCTRLQNYSVGQIVKVSNTGDYDILFDDSNLETVNEKLTRKMPLLDSLSIDPAVVPVSSHSSSSSRSAVLVFDQKSSSWRPASIASRNLNGSFRVRLAPTNEEIDVSTDQISFTSNVASSPLSLMTVTQPLPSNSANEESVIRRPASANLLQAGRERDRDRDRDRARDRDANEAVSGSNISGPLPQNRPHTASGGYSGSAVSADYFLEPSASSLKSSQTADGRMRRGADKRFDNPSSPISPSSSFQPHSEAPSGASGFVALDGESLFHPSSNKWNVNVLEKAPEAPQNRLLPASGTGLGVSYNALIRNDTWSPVLAYVFDIQSPIMQERATVNNVSALPLTPVVYRPGSPSMMATCGRPKSPTAASMDLQPGFVLPIDTTITVVPTSSHDCVEFGLHMQSGSCQILWEGEKNCCPLFMRLAAMPPSGACIEVKFHFYAHSVLIGCVSIQIVGTFIPSRATDQTKYLKPDMRVMSDVQVGMLRSLYVVVPASVNHMTARSGGNYIDSILETAVKQLPFLTIRRPEANEHINASYIRTCDHVMCCVDSSNVDAVEPALQHVNQIVSAAIDRESKVSYLLLDSEFATLKTKLMSSLNIPSVSICSCHRGVVEKWVQSDKGLKRHLRNKLSLSSNALSKLMFENYRIDRAAPVAMLFFPTNSPSDECFDNVTLYSALQSFKDNQSGILQYNWKLQFFCEDYVFAKRGNSHIPLEIVFTPALFLECYPLLKLTIALLLLAKVGVMENIGVFTAVNISDAVAQYSVHSLISLSIFYDEMEIFCRDCSGDQLAVLGASNGHKVIASSAQDSRLSNDEVVYDDMELLAITAQTCESAISNILLHGGLHKIELTVRGQLDGNNPSWLSQTMMKLFVIDDASLWISLGAYTTCWRNLLLLINPALTDRDGIQDTQEDNDLSSTADKLEDFPPRDPLEEITTNIKLGLRIKDENIAITTAKCLTKEGCESWEDVLNLVEFVGAIDDGAPGVITAHSFQLVNKFLLSAGVPVIAAGKLVAFLRQYHSRNHPQAVV